MRIKLLRYAMAALLLLVPLRAVPQTPSTQVWHVGLTALPSSSTQAIAATSASHYIWIDRLMLSNTSASSVTVTITDQGTNCNGGPCQIFPAVTLAANTVYAVDLGGARSYGGISWSATTANVVHGWMAGRY